MSKLYKLNNEKLAERWSVSMQASLPETKIAECLKAQDEDITQERIDSTIEAYLKNGVLVEATATQPEIKTVKDDISTPNTQNRNKDSEE